MSKPDCYITIAFVCPTRADFDTLWTDIRTRYKFCEKDKVGPQAFAVSMEDMFAKEEAIERVLNSDLEDYQKVECIGEFYSRPDFNKILEDWEIAA